MKVVVIGMGEVGKYVASVLAGEKHDVTIVDTHADNLAKAEEMMDVLALCGHAASMKTLRQAQVAEADLVAAVTDRDEINMLAALMAKQLGARRVVARVTRRDYLEDSDRGYYHGLLGIDLVVSVQILVANEIYKLIKSIGAVAVEDFAENQVELVQIPVGEAARVVGKPLRDVPVPEKSLVVALLRDGTVMIPGGADTVLEGDEVFLVGAAEQVAALEKQFGRVRQREAQNVVIVGGGDVGYSVARLLERDRLAVRLIDADADRCAELARLLDRTVILHGDGTDLALLQEEKIQNADVFIATSGDDEINLMSSLLAKNLGVRKTITLVNRPDYIRTYSRLGLDATVSPRLFAANQILKYARQGQVVTVALLADGKAEVLEIIPDENSLIAGKPLRDVNVPRGVVIAAVVSEKGVVVPGGSDVVAPGDHVVVFTLPEVRPAVERLFRKRVFSL